MSLKQPNILKIDKVLNKVLRRKCPECGSLLEKRGGKYGDFWGCSNFPKCDYSISPKTISKMKKISKEYS